MFIWIELKSETLDRLVKLLPTPDGSRPKDDLPGPNGMRLVRMRYDAAENLLRQARMLSKETIKSWDQVINSKLDVVEKDLAEADPAKQSEPADELTDVQLTCIGCRKPTIFKASKRGLKLWKSGALIQDALPDLDADKREMLISKLCPKCFATATGAE